MIDRHDGEGEAGDIAGIRNIFEHLGTLLFRVTGFMDNAIRPATGP